MGHQVMYEGSLKFKDPLTEEQKNLIKECQEDDDHYDRFYALRLNKSNDAMIYKDNDKMDSLVCEPIRLGHFNKGGQGDRIYSVEGKPVCLSANGGGRGAKTGLYKIDLPDGDYIVRKLTPTECERLQGFPDGYTECVSNSQRYKTLGNGFTVPVIEHILSHAFKRSSVAIKEEFYQKPLVRDYEQIAVNAHQNPDLLNQTNQ